VRASPLRAADGTVFSAQGVAAIVRAILLAPWNFPCFSRSFCRETRSSSGNGCPPTAFTRLRPPSKAGTSGAPIAPCPSALARRNPLQHGTSAIDRRRADTRPTPSVAARLKKSPNSLQVFAPGAYSFWAAVVRFIAVTNHVAKVHIHQVTVVFEGPERNVKDTVCPKRTTARGRRNEYQSR
jgi:hypothetical protein